MNAENHIFPKLLFQYISPIVRVIARYRFLVTFLQPHFQGHSISPMKRDLRYEDGIITYRIDSVESIGTASKSVANAAVFAVCNAVRAPAGMKASNIPGA